MASSPPNSREEINSLAYKIAVQRLDGTYRADDKIFEGPPPGYGAIVSHECAGEVMKVRIAGIRTLPGSGIGGGALDQVDAVEVS